MFTAVQGWARERESCGVITENSKSRGKLEALLGDQGQKEGS